MINKIINNKRLQANKTLQFCLSSRKYNNTQYKAQEETNFNR